MVSAENLVVAIAEPQLTGFNVQGCREIPSKAPKGRCEGATSVLPDSFLILVEVTLTDNTAGFPSGHLFHEANFYSSNLSVSAYIFQSEMNAKILTHKRSLERGVRIGNYSAL